MPPDTSVFGSVLSTFIGIFAQSYGRTLPEALWIMQTLLIIEFILLGLTWALHAESFAGVLMGKVLTLRPAVVEDAAIVPVTWVCGYATAPEKMTVKGENKTNIPPGYLPIRCRS